jgi:hypothetical protein
MLGWTSSADTSMVKTYHEFPQRRPLRNLDAGARNQVTWSASVAPPLLSSSEFSMDTDVDTVLQKLRAWSCA